MKKFQLFFVAPQMGFVLCGLAFAAVPESNAAAPTLKHEIVATLPHDENDFTQGLIVHNGTLIESTGKHGSSALIRKNIADGSVLQRRALPHNQFGEGIAVAGDRLIQLTWTAGVAWVYDLSFRRTGSFLFSGEGWGLTYDGERLMMSDGSAYITFRRPDTFDAIGGIRVRDGDTTVRRLNELEYARGWLYANVWQQERVAVIDPKTGVVHGWHDLSALSRGFARPVGFDAADHVLNGIAFDPSSGDFYLTGKCWPLMYRIRFEAPPTSAQPASATPQ